MATGTATSTAKHLIAGVGASLADAAALRTLLSALGPAPRLALIVVLGATETDADAGTVGAGAPMPVHVAVDGMMPPLGALTVVPPGQIAVLARGVLRLRRPKTPGERRAPVDQLLTSLADDAGDCAVGVVLTAAGSDGAVGLENIFAAGGLTMAAAAGEGARSDEGAAAAGFCDHVLPPAGLARVLSDYAEHLHVLPHGPAARGRHGAVHRGLPRVTELLRQHTGHDFRHYKPSTLVRRIERRMQVLRDGLVEDYVHRLERDPAEAAVLFRELLIGVTAFFRDADAFRSLADNVVAPLAASCGPDDELRVWVPGCATGEEAYSIAMLFSEALEPRPFAGRVRIFATDLNERALAVARRGSYPQGIALQVGAERLARFFTRRGRRYQVVEGLREMVVFSPHNLVSDPPFSRLDLISCRNLLIYLGPPLQKKLVPVFHYALKPGGYLFLGSSENLTGHGELFRNIDAARKIGQRKPVRGAVPPPGRALGPASTPRGAEPADTDLGDVARRIVLDEFAPAHAIVNDDGQVLYLSEAAGKFLQPPVGGFSASVVRMARRGLASALRTTLGQSARACRSAEAVVPAVQTTEARARVRVTVQPMPALGEAEGLFIVVLEDLGVALAAGEPGEGAGRDVRENTIEALERELARAREELERALQEQDTAHEELKSSNEELLSMNEELQSAIEELEASKEEVQAANAALAVANADLENLLRSTDIATIFLDARGAVRGFTPDGVDVYALRPGDTGRPLTDIACRLDGLPPLATDSLAAMLRTPDAVARHPDGRWFLRRVSGARDGDGGINGALVSFVDITAQKRIEEELRRASDLLRVIGETMPDLIYVKDRDSRMVWANPPVLEAIGRGAAEVFGFNDADFAADRAEGERIVAFDQDVMASGNPRVDEETLTSPDGRRRYFLSSKAPIRDADGVVTGIVGFTRDITGERDTRRELTASEARLRMALDVANMTAWAIDVDDLSFTHTPQLLNLLGRGPDGEPLRNVDDVRAVLWPEDRARVAAETEAELAAHGQYDLAYRLRRDDGTPVWVASRAVVVTEQGRQQVIGTTRDIDAAKRDELALALAARRFSAAVEALDGVLWTNDAEGRMAGEQPAWSALTGQSYAEYQGYGWADAVHPDDAQPTVEAWNEAVAAREPFLFAHRVRRADGVWRKFSIRALPVIGSEGELVEWVGVHTDVTDAEAAEEALVTSAGQLLIIAETMPQFVFRARPDGFVEYINQRWYDVAGVAPGRVLGDDWADLIHPDDLPAVVAAWTGSMTSGRPYEIEHRLLHPEGWRWVLARALPVRAEPDAAHPEGRILSWVGSGTDIEDSKRLQADLADVLSTKDALLHEVNHRVKNSLQLVTSLIALQINQTADARARDTLKDARQRIAVVANLHQRLYSTSLHDRMAFGPYLERLARDTLASVGRDHIRLDIHAADEAVLRLNQAVPLALIIGEVLTNAVKYAFPDGREGVIRVAAARDEAGALTVEVRDDGVGLEPGKIGGDGLGTRIVAALARQIRATTELTSDGTGTRFRIVVPPERMLDGGPEYLAR